MSASNVDVRRFGETGFLIHCRGTVARIQADGFSGADYDADSGVVSILSGEMGRAPAKIGVGSVVEAQALAEGVVDILDQINRSKPLRFRQRISPPAGGASSEIDGIAPPLRVHAKPPREAAAQDATAPYASDGDPVSPLSNDGSPDPAAPAKRKAHLVVAAFAAGFIVIGGVILAAGGLHSGAKVDPAKAATAADSAKAGAAVPVEKLDPNDAIAAPGADKAADPSAWQPE